MANSEIEKRRVELDIVEDIFDTSSGDIGVHMYAIRALVAGEPASLWAVECLNGFNSNLLNSPPVVAWRMPESIYSRFYYLTARTPRDNSHIALFRETEQEYRRINCEQMRVLLGGEDIQADDFGAAIDQEEMDTLLLQAASRGILPVAPEYLVGIGPEETWPDLLVSILLKGVPLTREIVSPITVAANELCFSDRFRGRVLTAAIHKLGCLMAVTDHITYDLASQGKSVPVDFQSTEKDAASNWQARFGESMPTLEGLYRKAHATIVELANPEDPLLQHLFLLRELPQLARVA